MSILVSTCHTVPVFKSKIVFQFCCIPRLLSCMSNCFLEWDQRWSVSRAVNSKHDLTVAWFLHSWFWVPFQFSQSQLRLCKIQYWPKNILKGVGSLSIYIPHFPNANAGQKISIHILYFWMPTVICIPAPLRSHKFSMSWHPYSLFWFDPITGISNSSSFPLASSSSSSSLPVIHFRCRSCIHIQSLTSTPVVRLAAVSFDEEWRAHLIIFSLTRSSS